MASSPIKRKRFQILDDLGEEEVLWMYIEECRTVRDLADRLFEPHGDAQRASCKELYDWLHSQPGRWERWQEARQFKATNFAEDALETALNANEGNVRSAKLKADYQKWFASVLDPRQYGNNSRATVEVQASTFELMLEEALRRVEEQASSRLRRIVEAEVIEETP